MDEPKMNTVNIYGQDYMLKSEADEEYINKIAQIVQDRMKDIEGTGLDPNSQQLKIAVLAAMNIADELFQSEEKKNKFGGNLVTASKSGVLSLFRHLKKGGAVGISWV